MSTNLETVMRIVTIGAGATLAMDLWAFVLRRFIDQLVRRVREINPTPVSDPETAALAMVSMLERSTFYALVGMVRVDREDLVDNLAAILHVGLFGGVRRRRG